MDALNTTPATANNFLNMFLKAIVFVFLFLVILFYFKIDLLNFKIFKNKTFKENDNYKPHETNRKLLNAYLNSNYSSETLNNFYIKSAYNSSKYDASCSVDRLKTIISQGFRCLDFNLIYKDNNVYVKYQIKGESFLDVLEVIDKHAFSNHYCSNHSDPIILNLRIDTNDYPQLFYTKLREIFDYNDSKYILSSNSLKDTSDEVYYNSVLTLPLESFKKKIIVCCNINMSEEHDLLQYVHINTLLVNTQDVNFTDDHNFIFDDNWIQQTTETDSMVNDNKDKLNMIRPTYTDYTIINPTTLHDEYGFSLRLMDLSSVLKFDEANIQDDNILEYLRLFDTNGYAFKLKPEDKRNIE